jgi:hypothetical protein
MGVIWVGMANFEALQPGSDPAVRTAFHSTGSLYGSALSGSSRRPVGGLLYVDASGVRWEPRIWLGRSTAKSWSVARESLIGLEVKRTPFPAFRSYDARLQTTNGDARFMVVDPEGLRTAISEMLASAA